MINRALLFLLISAIPSIASAKDYTFDMRDNKMIAVTGLDRSGVGKMKALHDFIENIQVSGTIQGWKNITGETLSSDSVFKFLRERLTEIQYQKKIAGLGPNAIALNVGADGTAPKGTIVVTEAFMKEMPAIQLGYLLHESRHESPEFAHVMCNYADLISLSFQCDDRLDGANGIQAAFLANYYHKCTNCSEEDKTTIARAAQIRALYLNPFLKFLGAKAMTNDDLNLDVIAAFGKDAE